MTKVTGEGDKGDKGEKVIKLTRKYKGDKR